MRFELEQQINAIDEKEDLKMLVTHEHDNSKMKKIELTTLVPRLILRDSESARVELLNEAWKAVLKAVSGLRYNHRQDRS